MQSYCRTCFLEISNTSSSVPLNRESYKHRLMFCVPEMDLRAFPDAKLCKDCVAALDVTYTFKTKYHEVKDEINKRLFDVTGRLTVKQEISLHNTICMVCRVCIEDVIDHSFYLAERQFYNSKLMLCVPEMDLRLPSDIKLCDDCHNVLDKIYVFKTKCLDVEKNIKEYLKSHDVIDLRGLSVWCNAFIKYEVGGLEDYMIKQEEIGLNNEVEITEDVIEQVPEHIHPHTSEKSFKCGYSNKQKSKSKIHIRTHIDEKLFKYSLCEYNTKQKSTLELHTRTHTGEKPFKCLLCEYSSAGKLGLKRHIFTHTGEKPFKCSLCEYSAVQKSNLIRHIRTHTGEKPFKCPLCKYSANAKSELKSHSRTHTGEKPFKCLYCVYSSAKITGLKRHTRTHTGEKPFKCLLCEYSSAEKQELIRHIRRHTGEKPFKCSLCEYGAVQKSNLIRHIRTHTGEKPFKCSLCEHSAYTKLELKRHIRKHVGANL